MTSDPRGLDPFDALRAPDDPIEPDPAFRTELRRRLESAARPTTDTGGATMPTTQRPTTQPATAAAADAPTRLTAVTPYLSVHDARGAIAWYGEAFGATLRFQFEDGDRIGHAEIQIGDAVVYLADEYPDQGYVGPRTRGGPTAAFVVHVDDPDTVYARAVELGATAERPVDDAYGARSGWLFDPFGHRWCISTFPEGSVPASPQADDLWNEVGYYTLAVGDLDRARAFYGELFGWRFAEENISPYGDRAAHVESSRVPFGIRGRTGEFVEPYFRVADLDAAIATVERLGGTVESVTQYDSGGNAVCLDDQGRRLNLWQPRPGY
jgi:uncharacterized glyoxalase superfamily protein PhnB/catechol 2,3-dioxygenase-like lactoylglutathione lyase family enzyme